MSSEAKGTANLPGESLAAQAWLQLAPVFGSSWDTTLPVDQMRIRFQPMVSMDWSGPDPKHVVVGYRAVPEFQLERSAVELSSHQAQAALRGRMSPELLAELQIFVLYESMRTFGEKVTSAERLAPRLFLPVWSVALDLPCRLLSGLRQCADEFRQVPVVVDLPAEAPQRWPAELDAALKLLGGLELGLRFQAGSSGVELLDRHQSTYALIDLEEPGSESDAAGLGPVRERCRWQPDLGEAPASPPVSLVLLGVKDQATARAGHEPNRTGLCQGPFFVDRVTIDGIDETGRLSEEPW